MSSPSIDLDMNLLSSPVPPPRVGEDGGVHSQSSFAFTENEHNVNNNKCTEDINGNSSNVFQSTFDVNMRGGNDSHSFAATAMSMKGSEYHSSASNNDTQSNITHESIMQTESTSTMDKYNTDENCDDDERMVINGRPTQKYNDMTKMVESWREELYMMNVKNSIMLDELVKLGADV